jgi:glycosyltransferase involved in cell wall biosynthesis
MNGGVNLHVFLSPCTHESRLLRQADCLLATRLFERVIVLGLGEIGLEECEQYGQSLQIERPRLLTRRWPKGLALQLFKYAEWALRTIARGIQLKPRVIHAHSLPALPVSALIAWFCRVPLIYDAHELETEQDGSRGLRKWLARRIEKVFIQQASSVLVVSQSIADWYSRHYDVHRLLVLRNIPDLQPTTLHKTEGTSLRVMLGVEPGAILFLYQGSLAPGRGIERLLRVFAKPDNARKHIVFMGYGALERLIRDYASRAPNIHFQQAVSPDKLLHYTSGADIGVCLIENTCLSYYFSLPNRLFEYFAAGLPVVINNFPEQRRIVEEFKCGWIVDETDEALLALIERIDMATVNVYRVGALRARETLTWQSERSILLHAYKDVA